MRRQLSPLTRLKNLSYTRYGACSVCGVEKEIEISGVVYCNGCKTKKGAFYG